MQKVRSDLPQKTIDVLKLEQAISNLYDEVAALPNKDDIEILFIQGLELSLYEYEQDKLWTDSAERYNYSEGSVPKLLAHLNLSRERFRSHFNLCFVFLVPLFALKYLMRRAPDFFDWRSGVLEFAMDAKQVEQESQRIWLEGDYAEYLIWTPQQRYRLILEIQATLEEYQQPLESNPLSKYSYLDLLVEQGNLFDACKNYTPALSVYEKAIAIYPNLYPAWYNRGNALNALGRKEAAISSYEEAIAINSYKHEAWNNRGSVLNALGRNEAAISSYDKAVAIKPDDHYAWYGRGIALNALGRNEEAITSYDKAVAIKPDDHYAWYGRGVALFDLGRNEEAITSYDEAIAINSYKHEAWSNRGNALFDLGRNEEAIASYEEAIAIKSDYYQAWYNKACCYALWSRVETAIENLERAIELNLKYREKAKTDADFDSIRQDERFRALVGE